MSLFYYYFILFQNINCKKFATTAISQFRNFTKFVSKQIGLIHTCYGIFSGWTKPLDFEGEQQSSKNREMPQMIENILTLKLSKYFQNGLTLHSQNKFHFARRPSLFLLIVRFCSYFDFRISVSQKKTPGKVWSGKKEVRS